MRYRVTYRKRFDQKGQGADAPQAFLDVPEGVVAEAEFVERFEPDSLHVEERMEEDDDFLAFGSEIWEYDVMPGREREFKEAVLNSGMAMELDEVEEIEDLPRLDGQQ